MKSIWTESVPIVDIEGRLALNGPTVGLEGGAANGRDVEPDTTLKNGKTDPVFIPSAGHAAHIGIITTIAVPSARLMTGC